MNTLDTNNIKWSENVIIADADYIDRVAFDLIVNFERMINRRIQPADMAQWAVCIALDGGLREEVHNGRESGLSTDSKQVDGDEELPPCQL